MIKQMCLCKLEQKLGPAKKDILIAVNEDREGVSVLSMTYPSVFSQSHTTARYAIIAMSVSSPATRVGAVSGQTMKQQKDNAIVSYSLCINLFLVMHTYLFHLYVRIGCIKNAREEMLMEGILNTDTLGLALVEIESQYAPFIDRMAHWLFS